MKIYKIKCTETFDAFVVAESYTEAIEKYIRYSNKDNVDGDVPTTEDDIEEIEVLDPDCSVIV